jgi:hypothetical protein
VWVPFLRELLLIRSKSFFYLTFAATMNTIVASPFEGLTCLCGHAIKARLRGMLLWDFCFFLKAELRSTEIRRGQAQHSYFMSCSGSVFGTPVMRAPARFRGRSVAVARRS